MRIADLFIQTLKEETRKYRNQTKKIWCQERKALACEVSCFEELERAGSYLSPGDVKMAQRQTYHR